MGLFQFESGSMLFNHFDRQDTLKGIGLVGQKSVHSRFRISNLNEKLWRKIRTDRGHDIN